MKNIFTLSCLTLILIVCFSLQTTAQDEPKKDSLKYKINDVVVVGTRASERIIDIPYSVFRVDKKELAFGKKISAKDVLADVPGLFLQNRFGNSDLRVSIRGFGTRSNSGVRGLKVLHDGIPESEPDGESVMDAIDLTSLATVEVVKGNLSSLYANAPGGIINFVTDTFFPDNFIGTFNQAGRFGFMQNGIKVGMKDNNQRFFLSYRYRNMDGYRQHSTEFQHLVNTIYQAFIGTNSTLSFHGNFVHGFNKLPGSLTRAEFDRDPFMADPLAISQDYKRATKKGRGALRFLTTFGSEKQNELEITGYASVKELEKADNENYAFTTRYSLGSILKLSNRSEVFGMKNILTVGNDYAFQAGPLTLYDNVGGVPGISVTNHYNESLSNLGIYILDHLTLIDQKLDLFVSGRYDYNRFARETFIPFGFTDSVRVMSGFSPKIGLNYKLTPVIALYSSYGLSYDYPALSEMTNNPLTSNLKYSLNPDLDPQQSNNFELGIKGNLVTPQNDFMKKIFFEVTYFNYTIKDEIIPFVINQKTYFRNSAQTSRQGIECGFMSHPFDDVEWTVNYTYAHFKYDNYITTVYTPSGSKVENYSGKMVPSIPTHIVNFILVYELKLTQQIQGMLLWDCDYIAEMYVDDANTEKNRDFFYGNIMAGLTFDMDQFVLTAFAGMTNIFDKRYASYISINDYYGRYYETAEPRMYYAGINFNLKLL